MARHVAAPKFEILSTNQAIMMSQKPLPASTFFQTLKPFTHLVWQLFISVIVGVSIIVFLFNRVYNLDVRIKFPGAPKPLKFQDVSYNVENTNRYQ